MNETTDKRENQQQWVNSIEVYFYGQLKAH